MTCVSCETLIGEELKGLKGVKKVTVCRKKSEADVDFDDSFDEKAAIAIIENLGYSVGEKKRKSKNSIKQWFFSLLIVFILYILFKFFSSLGVFDWLDVDPENISYGLAFMIGIVASMSTCLAVVGAVIISFSAKYKGKGSFYEANIKPQLLFHAGRWASFFVLGGVLGILGSWINFSSSFMGIFTVIIALVLAWLGLNILGLVPSLATVGIRMPKNFTKTWSQLKDSEHRSAPVLLGAFSFFLPCGFTQSMQLFAVSSGSFWAGAWTLLLFAVGTTPVLFSVGSLTSKVSHGKSMVLKRVVGFVVILFALYTFSSGMALAGISLNLFSGGDGVSSEIKGNVQEITMSVNYQGFTPNTFTIKKGIPVRWVINGDQVTGCTNEIISPQLGIKKKIISGKNVIEFTPQEVGTIGFSCWMGMVRGKFIVTEADGNLPVGFSTDVIEDTSLGGATCSGNGVCGGTCGSAGCGCGSLN